MRRAQRITDRPEWPAVLKRLEELAQEGYYPSIACKKIAAEFKGFSDRGVFNAMLRREVPSYPSNDPERAAAWARGGLTYRRSRQCLKCGGHLFNTVDGRCHYCDQKWISENR